LCRKTLANPFGGIGMVSKSESSLVLPSTSHRNSVFRRDTLLNIFISVSADEDASEGAHMFSVSIGADGRNLKDVPMTVNVVEGEGSGSADLEKVRRGLEIGLIVLVILLVILGLIIGLSKLRNEDESEETYY